MPFKAADPVRVALLSLNSQYVHSSLAPWCLVAGLEHYARPGYEAQVLEGTVNELPGAVLDRIEAARPQLLGISCAIWNITFVAGLLKQIKASLPQCVIVLGGPEVSYRAEDALTSYPQADYLIAGEGELPFAGLLDALRGYMPLDEVPGLCYRLGEGFVIQEPFTHVGMHPSPYSQAYLKALGGRIAYLETSRGCPYHCAFCLSGREERLRTVALERAYEEILLLADSDTKTIKLIDRTFNADRARALNILRFIAEDYGLGIPKGLTFHFEIAGDLLDEETLALIERSPAGLFQFEIGLQSMDELTLRRVRRRTDMSHLTRQVKRLIRCGKAHVHLDLIAGLPGEGLKEFVRGFDTAFALRPHALQLGFLKLIHGSAMRRETELYPCDYDPLAPYQVRSTPWMSESDFDCLKLAEHALDKLFNSGRFRRTLSWLTQDEGIQPFRLFLHLGRVIAQAEAAAKEGRLSLEALTDCVYHSLGELMPGQEELLRDLLLQDRFSSTPTSVLPACLKRKDPRLHAVKRELKSRFPRPQGVVRVVGILYAGEEDLVIYCDYVPGGRHPVTGEYTLASIQLQMLNE